MNSSPDVSLINLTSQFPFEIDDAVKKEICFGETLIISCGHYDGDIGDDSSDSEWSCHDTTETESSQEIKDDELFEITDKVEEETKRKEVEEEEDDFQFYFFPDCSKPQLPQDSKASLIVVDGMPKINTAVKGQIVCTCDVDKEGNCPCHTKLPCRCGAKTAKECTCLKREEICICHESNPLPVCTCQGSDICLCHPDGKIRPVCTCDEVDKPCVCHPGKFPSPVCTCEHKPKFHFDDLKSVDEAGDEGTEEEYKNEPANEEEHEPCECQKSKPKPHCLCLKGKECTCKENACICGVQKTCVCEPTDSQEAICKSEDSKSICSCPFPKECTCDASADDCKCFPKRHCSCGDPDNCKCFVACDCTEPCICDTQIPTPQECICLDKSKQAVKGLICTCPCKEEESKKLKRVRAGKQGYRWCHDVDPRHTYFDYGYGRHDKISYKEKEREKVKILGLHDEKQQEDICEVHGVKAPQYKKKIRKSSIDCCSAVGGISICVETLGEDKDKLLVQVVSHSSKEGAKTGSKLVGILDCNLHTLEENRSEYITKKDITKERRSYMAICENGYYNKVTRICGERHLVKRLYHSFEEARNFLLEGANVVLLRYFALRRYRGNIKTETVLMNGTICESIYVQDPSLSRINGMCHVPVILPATTPFKPKHSNVNALLLDGRNGHGGSTSPDETGVCLGVSQAIVNGKPLFVVKVERHIIEPSGFIHQTLTVLTLRGYIVTHEWADNCYMIHLNPLLRVVPEKDEIEPHAPLRERWRDDLQLLSDYLDFKSTRSSEGGRYVTESGALTGTVRDYLQSLLLLRPHDALHFTRHYFSAALSALDLPHDEYFDAASKHVRYYFFEE